MNIHHPSRNKKTLTPKSIHLLSTKIRPFLRPNLSPQQKKTGQPEILVPWQNACWPFQLPPNVWLRHPPRTPQKGQGVTSHLGREKLWQKTWDFHWVVLWNQIKINENHKKQSKTPTENQDGTQRKNSPRNGLKSGAKSSSNQTFMTWGLKYVNFRGCTLENYTCRQGYRPTNPCFI